MAFIFGGGAASATGALVGSVVAGAVLAGVASVTLTTVVHNANDSAPTPSDVNAPRYADQ
jgi:hypothetical protein